MDERGPLTGEPLALDLVNTRPAGPDGRRTDLIATPELLAAWLSLEADRLPAEARGSATAADLAALHAVRADTGAVVDALLEGAAPPRAALAGLNAAQRAAPPVRELHRDGTGVRAVTCRTGPAGAVLAAVFAEAAVDLVTGPGAAGIKRCEAEGCVMLFLPAHPRRRWCSPARCGNRARVARYYRRHRAAQAGSEPS
ncbi:CGNR zinc finger domain-containing protein [Nocardiopsis changdeensis]|uniref:ABATE domain-containing protein n=1 Tax=Nocardiopsis changdeensis TaxID=2831969 RepID=A0ABX8BWH2_9ACTN|nr:MULTISPECIES: CGNR zinc finger domain-containing protein [Nocardiopsis]QUX25462.1 ABATE domain-containing protein [Nocardiopsis changdeensis]QYX35848.1 CGNR zinc finger domain-containing protein [Nocardiopsis sp. MT53]